MPALEVLAIQRISADEAAMIKAVDASIKLTDAGGWFDGEIRETWPAFTSDRYLAPDANGSGCREERDRLLAEAEVVLGGWPFPLDLRARAPQLKWLHQRPAGASNLLRGDLWGSDVVVTTSRGSGNTLAMAEYALAGIMYFAKGLPQAAVDRDAGRFSHRAYRYRCKARPCASSVRVASARMWAGSVPPWACGLSARAERRATAVRCRKVSRWSAVPPISTICWGRPISW